MSASSSSTSITDDYILVCLACGDPFTPLSLADGVLPILFSCGHTVCVDCAKNVALSLPGYDGKWACGWCKRGDGGAVNAGVIALVECVSEGVDLDAVLSRFQVDVEPSEAKVSPVNFSVLSEDANASMSSALSDVERVNAARSNMRAGYESSRASFIADVDSLLSAILAHRDRVLGEAKELFDARDKALGAQVEELSVKVSLLRQAVDVCKAAVAGTVNPAPAVYESVEKGVKGLTREPFGGLPMCPVVGLGVDIEAVMKGVEASMYVKRGVSAPDCELGGLGLQGFTVGDGSNEQNVLSVECQDERRALVEGVDPLDVSINVLSLGAVGKVQSVPSVAPGVLKWVYILPTDRTDVEEVIVAVCAYGKPVTHSPVRVSRAFLPASTVLLPVESGTQKLFISVLKTWVPAAHQPELLFRMSRDGTNTSDFHSRCDGKANTLVLVLSDNGYVFGGYADKAWRSDGSGSLIPSTTSFIFTVRNPHGIPPTRYPVRNPDYALYGNARYGPVFGNGDVEVGYGGSLTSSGRTSFGHHVDTTGKGSGTFTGAAWPRYSYTPAEVEVWQL